jgi:hypothetical protein
MIKTVNLSHPKIAVVNSINNAIFEAKLKDINFSRTPTIVACIIGSILLNQDYVYAKGATQEGTEVINFLRELGPPTLLTIAELYKVRDYIKMYMKNLKLIIKK